MKRLIVALLVIYSMVIMTACPSREDVESARNASQRLAGISKGIAEVTGTLFTEGKLSLEKKNKIADAFIKVSKAGEKFDQMLIRIEAIYGNKPPETELQSLSSVFDDEVIKLFLEALDELTGVEASAYLTAVKNAKKAIIAISKLFGSAKESSVKVRLESHAFLTVES